MPFWFGMIPGGTSFNSDSDCEYRCFSGATQQRRPQWRKSPSDMKTQALSRLLEATCRVSKLETPSVVLDAAMLVVSHDFLDFEMHWVFQLETWSAYCTDLDECEGCRVHNLHCVKGTGLLHGFTTHGHFAEYSLSDYKNAMVLPSGMDPVSTAPLFCAGVTGKCVTTCAP